MAPNVGFDILHNGVWRTSRDTAEGAYEAARFAKGLKRNLGVRIEVVDRAAGTKMLMLEDGRTA